MHFIALSLSSFGNWPDFFSSKSADGAVGAVPIRLNRAIDDEYVLVRLLCRGITEYLKDRLTGTRHNRCVKLQRHVLAGKHGVHDYVREPGVDRIEK